MILRSALYSLVGLFVFSVLFTGCRCIDCGDDDNQQSADVAPWTALDLRTTGGIIGVEASSDELLVFTAREYVRGTPDDERFTIIERRQFPTSLRTLGRPAVHPLVFARAALNTISSDEIIEFQLIQSSSATRRFTVNDLGPENIALEFDASKTGAFDQDARTYVQPVINRATRTVSLMFFKLDYDLSFTEFTELEYVGLVELPGVSEDDKVVSSIKFIDDQFYVATKSGAFSVTTSGVVWPITAGSEDVRDVFKYDGDFYASRSAQGPLFQSTDGQTFRPGIGQDLRLVDVLGRFIVSQNFEGWTYEVTDSISVRPKPLKLNPDFPLVNSNYFGIARFANRYYMGVEERLYYAATLEKVN